MAGPSVISCTFPFIAVGIGVEAGDGRLRADGRVGVDGSGGSLGEISAERGGSVSTCPSLLSLPMFSSSANCEVTPRRSARRRASDVGILKHD